MTSLKSSTDHNSLRLCDTQREELIGDLERDGYVVLPQKLPSDLMSEALAAIDRLAVQMRQQNPDLESIKLQNCVDYDAAFRHLMMYEPALQLCFDVFGPMFHLNQSNLVSRPREDQAQADFISSTPWHADGPRPNMFPNINGAMGLHYLKFGYFLTDLTHGNGGSLQVIRGSHRRPELDGKKGRFIVEEYADDLVQFDCEAGTVVAFHQAQWHAAPPNLSDVERKNIYISYCPTWMRPLDREFPSAEQLQRLSDEERWLLGEPRPAQRWWLPNSDDFSRMARFRRDSQS